MTQRQRMLEELKTKSIFNIAQKHAFKYLDELYEMDVFPSPENLSSLSNFKHPLSQSGTPATEVIEFLQQHGSQATTIHTGGRYYGFVNGSTIPVSLGVKWLTDVWDQNGGLYLTSPINAQIEDVCESWLIDILGLPETTKAGFVSGTSMANLCGMAAARQHLLQNLGWDVNQKGLNGAPRIRIVAHEQVHSCIKKTLALLGFGIENVEWVPSDDQGRIHVDEMPLLDASCLVLLQAGNVNTGAFDDFETVCNLADEAGAWVHIDGAFGLWAEACSSLKYLTKGLSKASSWAVDGHKTLNTPYDSGVILCKHPEALVRALQATGAYIEYTDQREPMLYTPEMSKRSRAMEMWAILKYLGKDGVDEMITGFNTLAIEMAEGLKNIGFDILNEVVFNQVLFKAESDEETNRILKYVQNSGKAWMGPSKWNGDAVIRISVCSWMTSSEDVKRTIAVFREALSKM